MSTREHEMAIAGTEAGLDHVERPSEYGGKQPCVVHVDCCKEKEKCCCTPEPSLCTFEIYMSRARVTEQQNLDGKLEVQLTGYANGETVTHPSASTWFHLHKKWGWLAVNRLVATVTVEKGSQKAVWVMAEAIEFDISVAGASEVGSSDFDKIVVGCGLMPPPVVVTIDLKKLKIIGQGKGEIQVEFRAYQVAP